MAVQLTIPYETLVTLVEQLPPEERQDLARRLQAAPERLPPADDAWEAAFRVLLIDAPVGDDFSTTRADWYDDDGR